MNQSSTAAADSRESAAASSFALDIFHWEVFALVNNSAVCTLIGILGIASNVINMAVFARQGLAVNSVNACFFSVAVSDIIRIVSVEWANICFNPYIDNAKTPLLFLDIFYVTGGWTVGCACRITLHVIAYVTAERYLSVVFPFTVRSVLTQRRTSWAIILIYIFNAATLAPEYSSIYLSWRFDAARNRTMMGVAFRENRAETKGITFLIHAALVMVGLCAVVVLTTGLVVQLRRQTRWREANAKQNGAVITKRDRQSVTLVIVVATSVSVCYVPIALLSLVTVFVPDFYVGGRYYTLFRDTWALAFLTGVINSSCNLLIYLKMSSKFRATFLQLMLRQTNTKTETNRNQSK